PELSNVSVWAVLLNALPLDSAFYNSISFAFIFFVAKFALQLIASMLDFVASLPVLNSLNRILGAVLGFLAVYLIIFIVLSILALTPAENVQAWIADSPLALFIIEHTPYLSEKLKKLWFSTLDNFVYIVCVV